jgi:putative Mg2+ transporter-C (MgtC) family protein
MTWQYVLTIFVGAILGGAIGLEREYRSKEAGFRTHFLVGLGSALFMVLSMHGFDGFEAQPGVIIQRDPARMAAQVVSGIGFIGAGTIIFQKNVVKGLTTAAGLWVTSAIGMTAGVGMYAVAIASTVLVLVCLEGSNFLHHRVFKSRRREYDADEKND